MAAIVEEFWESSHSDLIVGKLMRGYELLWVPMAPGVDVASLHIGHLGPLDVGCRRAADAGAAVYGSISEALACGGRALAVDGVVIVAERNRKGGREPELDHRGQAQDRRVEFFDQVAAACRTAGARIPIFIDKHLGATWEQARHVYETAGDLGLPLMAGSSVPVTVRFPPAQLAEGSVVEEVVVVSTGIGEAPIFHPFELAQSMLERRHGFETGVVAVEYLAGNAFWAAWVSGERWSRELEAAALAAVPHVDGSPRDFYRSHPTERRDPGPARLAALAGREEAVLIEYADGVRLAILLLSGYMLRRAVAIRSRGTRTPLVTTTPTGSKLPEQPMVGPLVPASAETKPATWNFDHLAFFVDRFLNERRSPYQVERTLLSSGVVDAAFESRVRGGRVETPHLAIAYQPTDPRRSTSR